MLHVRKLAVVAIVAASAITLAGCSSGGSVSSSSSSTATPQKGGTITVAYNAQPPTLDGAITTALATADFDNMILEPLLTTDANFKVQPMLAESWKTDDYKTFTFKLRKNVKFSNGQPFTSADVVATLNRWGKVNTFGQSGLKGATITAPDDYTVQIVLPSTNYLLPDTLTNAYILPASSIAKADPTTGVPTEDIIGTGPYELDEWVKDDHITLKRYDGYSSRTEKSSGLAGKKTQYADKLTFDFVTDASTRLNGLLSGQYDVDYGVDADGVSQVKSNSDFSVDSTMSVYQIIEYNKAKGIGTDENFRKAVNAALNMGDIMKATYSDPSAYWLSPSFGTKGSEWYSTEGADSYNQHDLALAKKYLAKSSYNGEEVRFIASPDYPNFYNAAVVAKQELAKIGVNVTIVSSDWATFLANRANKDAWDLFTTSVPYNTPFEYLWAQPTWPGWVNSPDLADAYNQLLSATSDKEAVAANAKIQKVAYQDIPMSNVGGVATIVAWSNKVGGYSTLMGGVFGNMYRTGD